MGHRVWEGCHRLLWCYRLVLHVLVFLHELSSPCYMQAAMCSLPNAVCNVQHAECCVQHAKQYICNVLDFICSVHSAVCYMHCSPPACTLTYLWCLQALPGKVFPSLELHPGFSNMQMQLSSCIGELVFMEHPCMTLIMLL